MIEVDLCYELDPYELKLDEMIEAEPEPEMIEGLPASDALTPADRYLELFEHVQSAKIFPDSKTFPDCAPKMDPLDILIRYRKVRRHRDFDLRKFVENHFWLPEVYSSEYVSDPQNSLKEHIDQLWPVLTREPQDHIPWSSLLALPQSYIVPGGRFSETYYWDSYFTMLGLAESGREDLLKCMADNFAWMIENYGHIPTQEELQLGTDLARGCPWCLLWEEPLFHCTKPSGVPRGPSQLHSDPDFSEAR